MAWSPPSCPYTFSSQLFRNCPPFRGLGQLLQGVVKLGLSVLQMAGTDGEQTRKSMKRILE